MLQHYRETNHITTFVFMILEDNIYIYIKTYKYICVYNIKNECTTGKAPGQIFVLGKGAWANWNNCGKSLNLRSALSMNRITLRERVNGTKPLMLDVLSHLFLKRRRKIHLPGFLCGSWCDFSAVDCFVRQFFLQFLVIPHAGYWVVNAIGKGEDKCGLCNACLVL